jgi:5-methylcytosine-specific restriction endonuclease McrA
VSPYAPQRPCPTPGCPHLVTKGPCPDHALERERRRGSAYTRGYTPRQHVPWAKVIRARDLTCQGEPHGIHGSRPEPSWAADHIVPLRLWSYDHAAAARQLATILADRGITPKCLDPWSLDNGQGLCRSCHNRKSWRERGQA